jgi:hypothetical protein
VAREPMGLRAAVVRADWPVLDSMWAVSTIITTLFVASLCKFLNLA